MNRLIENPGFIIYISPHPYFHLLQSNNYAKSSFQKSGPRHFDLTSPKRSLKQKKRTVQLSWQTRSWDFYPVRMFRLHFRYFTFWKKSKFKLLAADLGQYWVGWPANEGDHLDPCLPQSIIRMPDQLYKVAAMLLLRDASLSITADWDRGSKGFPIV